MRLLGRGGPQGTFSLLGMVTICLFGVTSWSDAQHSHAQHSHAQHDYADHNHASDDGIERAKKRIGQALRKLNQRIDAIEQELRSRKSKGKVKHHRSEKHNSSKACDGQQCNKGKKGHKGNKNHWRKKGHKGNKGHWEKKGRQGNKGHWRKKGHKGNKGHRGQMGRWGQRGHQGVHRGQEGCHADQAGCEKYKGKATADCPIDTQDSCCKGSRGHKSKQRWRKSSRSSQHSSRYRGHGGWNPSQRSHSGSWSLDVPKVENWQSAENLEYLFKPSTFGDFARLAKPQAPASSPQMRMHEAAADQKRAIRTILGLDDDQPMIAIDIEDKALEARILAAIRQALGQQADLHTETSMEFEVELHQVKEAVLPPIVEVHPPTRPTSKNSVRQLF